MYGSFLLPGKFLKVHENKVVSIYYYCYSAGINTEGGTLGISPQNFSPPPEFPSFPPKIFDISISDDVFNSDLK